MRLTSTFALTFVHNALSVSIANALAIATTLRHCTHISFHLVLAASEFLNCTFHILDQPLNHLHATHHLSTQSPSSSIMTPKPSPTTPRSSQTSPPSSSSPLQPIPLHMALETHGNDSALTPPTTPQSDSAARHTLSPADCRTLKKLLGDVRTPSPLAS